MHAEFALIKFKIKEKATYLIHVYVGVRVGHFTPCV